MTKTLEIPCVDYSILADWYEGRDKEKVFLILHGFTSSRARQSDFTSSIVTSTGACALVIDLSGHGESPFNLDDTTPAQHISEVIHAFEWIKKHYPSSKISVIGSSYGGFLAAHLSRYRSFEKLVLRAPAIYRPETLHDPWLIRFQEEDNYRQAIQSYRRNSELLQLNTLFSRNGARFAGHTLVVEHQDDEIVPSETILAYINAFQADKYTAEGFRHAVSQSDVSDDQLVSYHTKISDWLNQSA